MNWVKTLAVPIALIVIFGVAFVAGVRNLKSGEPSAGSNRSGQLDFAADTASAFARAKKEGKIVMVKYGAEWCGFCQDMKKEAFADAGVAGLLSGVVPVDIDIDSPGADADWLQEHEVGPIPTVTFFRADGSKIGELVGYGGIASFKEEVKRILAKA